MDLDSLRRLAAEHELSLNYIAKDEMISKLLLNLQGFDDIILKGGTAINRVYLKNKRFSEDIDLDMVYEGGVRQALMRAKDVVGKIEGFQTEKARIMNETIRYDLFFTNPLNHKDKIRLEFKVIKKAVNYSKKVVNFGFAPYDAALLNVYDVEELIKHKIECVMSRKEGKDFFDLYYLLDLPHNPIKAAKEKIIERITLAEKEIKQFANITNHYIPRNQRPNWGVFLEELKEKIERKL